MKVALLSNVNTDFVVCQLSKKYDMVPSVGYGSIWEKLLDRDSSVNRANPDALIIIIDIEDLLDLDIVYDYQEAAEKIDQWFTMLDTVIHSGYDYFISDVRFRSEIPLDNDSLFEELVKSYWIECLRQRMMRHSNVHVLRLEHVIRSAGKSSFYSDKLWYMGKIPFTNAGTKLIADEISNAIELLNKPAKKLLILDLDNTLWGGILGESGIEGIELSDDRVGAIYKKVQRLIKMMTKSGVLLAICSKNNAADVQKVWEKHPHMILRKEDFAAIRINWVDKAENILSIADELNLGVDSFVFLDDMPAERDNIRQRIPDVIVPEFPKDIEAYPKFILDVFHAYFRRMRITEEDASKIQQYVENAQRKEASEGISYEEFLESLQLRVEQVELNEGRLERVVQLIGKTNQFNLTTKRYTRKDIERMIDSHFKLYTYRVSDRFGDYGLVAVIIVDLDVPAIDSFLMSCRIMGKQVENYFINDVEEDLLEMGFSTLGAAYIPTKKNLPVSHLYDDLGYTVVAASASGTQYSIDLENRPARKFFVNTSEN